MAEIQGENQGALLGDLPSDNLNSTLDNYDPSRNTYPEEGVYALGLARALVALEPGKPAGLLLTGRPGTGKTHLAVGIGRAIAEQGGRAAFVRFHDRGLELSDIPRPAGNIGWEYDLGEMVAAHDVLIFDDVPGEMMPGAQRSLQALAVSSYSQGKRVVMTSNHSAPEIINQLAQPAASEFGASDISAAVRERIRQTWSLVEFRGESFRSGQEKWYKGIERPEDSPTINEAVRAAGQLEEVQAEETVVRAMAEILLHMAATEGVPQAKRDALQAALDRVRKR